MKNNTAIGFIGAGNMGTAMIKSILNKGFITRENIYVSEVNEAQKKKIKDETGVNVTDCNAVAVQNSDIVFLAVKPDHIKGVLQEIKGFLKPDHIIVSIAVGISIKFIKDITGTDKKVIRTMPNTPALVGEGMTVAAFEEPVTTVDYEKVKAVLECFGKVELLEEKLLSEVTALTGSSPAYVFIFIEAMADAAVLSGIPRGTAYRLAAQAVLGSAKMVLETGKHPGELKDQVCSPGGTTIEAVYSLEKNGFRAAVIEAMDECTRKAREISKGLGA